MNEQGTLNLSQGDRQLEPAPCALGSRTSRAAAGKLTRRTLGRQMQIVFDAIKDASNPELEVVGLTDIEGAEWTEIKETTYRARRNWLAAEPRCLIRKAGTRTNPVSHRENDVWIVNAPAGGEVK